MKPVGILITIILFLIIAFGVGVSGVYFTVILADWWFPSQNLTPTGLVFAKVAILTAFLVGFCLGTFVWYLIMQIRYSPASIISFSRRWFPVLGINLLVAAYAKLTGYKAVSTNEKNQMEI